MNAMTDIQLAIALDPDGVFRADPAGFAEAACEMLLSADACLSVLRLGARPSLVPADEARRYEQLADSDGAFGFGPAELRRMFAEPALLARVAAVLHPALAADFGAVTARPTSDVRVSSGKRSRKRLRIARRRTQPTAALWAGVAAAACVLLTLMVALSGRSTPSAQPDGERAGDRITTSKPELFFNNHRPDANGSTQPTANQMPGDNATNQTPPESVNQPDSPVQNHNAPEPASKNNGGNAPRETVDRTPPGDNANVPTPRDPDPTPRTNQPPRDTVENPPQPVDPSNPQPLPTEPTAQPRPVLSVVQLDGRCTFTAADGSELDAAAITQLLPGTTVALTSGSLSLSFMLPDADGNSHRSFGRLVLHGRCGIRVDETATASAPVIGIERGELLLDTAALPGVVASAWNLSLGLIGNDHRLRVTQPPTGDESFVAAIDCSSSRFDVNVLAGGACATLGVTSLRGMGSASMRLRDGDVRTSGNRDSLPTWIARGHSESVLLTNDFEGGALPGWGGTIIAEPATRAGINHVLRMGPGTATDPADSGMQRCGFAFAAREDAAHRLPNHPGLVLHLRIRAEKPCTLTIHFFDGAIRENFSVDLPLQAGWQQLDLPLSQFRSRADDSPATAAQRFQNLSIITPVTGGAVDIDDLRLVRELR